ncbi:hypothetical protein HLB44_33095 [Aquincola sp. S2]|uniref:Uncharacterized protein n=1 Tax=Pseudaquabacterium terrae TaxID=2732868 RepID=A0ABX2ETG3_9BURK|nr:hypothetical protein [Aquabacterium terrae]NRF71834.1 hypothetical protein [Aquabacterium terrae]
MHVIDRSPATRRLALLMATTALALTACGGGGSAGTPPPPPAPLALATPGTAATKVRANGGGWVLLTEKLRRLENVTTPDRRLLVSTDGRAAGTPITAPAGWSLIDVAVHPSGQLSVVLATDKALKLQRRAADGALVGESDFGDAQAASDPFIGDPIVIRDSSSLLPHATRDAVRIAPLGEDLVLAVRTGRNAVVAHRLVHAGAGQFNRSWRRLVEPGVPIGAVGLTSGSFDPFNSLDNQWKLSLDVDAQGRSAIAVSVGNTELAAGHAQYFNEPVAAVVTHGALATRLDAQGQRLGTTVIDTLQRSEVHAVRWAGEQLLVAGRVRTEQRADGFGWDGWLARLPANGQGGSVQVLDFDRGDVILDLVPTGDGRLMLAGATGYWQNPAGGSISEDAQPLLAFVPAAGGAASRVNANAGPRHNQLRSLSAWQGRWLIGGLENGPGTHSADADPARLTADGYLRDRTLAPF